MDGVKVTPHTPTPLRPGSRLTFGNLPEPETQIRTLIGTGVGEFGVLSP